MMNYDMILLGMLLASILLLGRLGGTKIQRLADMLYQNPAIRMAMSLYYLWWLVLLITSGYPGG